MIDHAQRIAEEKRIDEMERSVRPLIIMCVIALIAILADGLLDAYAAHKYAYQIKNESLFVGALNGKPVDIDDGIATCRVEKFNLVEGIK